MSAPRSTSPIRSRNFWSSKPWGLRCPPFAHVPYVAEPGSKAKMSKRKTQEYEDQGVLVYLHQYIEQGLSSRCPAQLPGTAGLEL